MDNIPCVVIGAGIAGINAVLWLSDFGVPYRWFDPGEVGGTLRRVNNPIHNFPGRNYPRGMPIVQEHIAQLHELGYTMPEPHHVHSIEQTEDSLRVCINNNEQPEIIESTHVILATGTAYRTLGVPGEVEYPSLISQSVSGSVHVVAGQTVAIVGAGDASFEGALILARNNCTVHVFCRRAHFKARPEFTEKLLNHPRVHIWPIPTEITRIAQTPNQRARLSLNVQGTIKHLIVERVFVRIGVAPVLPKLSEAIQCDEQGYLIVNSTMQTSSPNLLAAGDVTSQPLRAVVNAASDGARAARHVAHALGYVRS